MATQSPQHPPQTSRRLWYVIGGFFAFIALLVIAWPTYKWAKKLRAAQLAENSISDMEQENWQGAMEDAHAAYLMDGQSLTSIRAMAKLYSTIHPGRAEGFWTQLLNHPELTTEDEREAVRFYARSGKVQQATSVLRKILTTPPHDIEDYLLAIDFHYLRNNPQQALHSASEALDLFPDSKELQLRYTRLIWALHGAEGEALQRMKVLATSQDNIAFEALLVMASTPNLSNELMKWTLNQLEKHPSTSSDRMIRIAELQLKLNNPAFPLGKTPSALSDYIHQWKTTPPIDRAPYLRWLNHNKLHSFALTFTTEEEAKVAPHVFLAWADSMSLSGKWKELDQLFQHPESLPIPLFHSSLFRSRISIALKEPDVAKLRWKRALASTENNPVELWYAVSYAMRMKRTDFAEEALWKLTSISGSTDAAYTSLIRLAQNNGKTNRLHEVLKKYLDERPFNLSVKNDYTYISLLLGKEDQDSVEIASELFKSHPNIMAYRVTLSLSLLKTGQPKPALILMDRSRVNWDEMPDHWKLVYARSLHANGHAKYAKEIVSKIQREKLRKEELQLIKEVGW